MEMCQQELIAETSQIIKNVTNINANEEKEKASIQKK